MVLVSRRYLSAFVFLFLVLSLLLVACERPLQQGDGEEETPAAATPGAGDLPTADPNVGGGVPGDYPGPTPVVTEEPATEEEGDTPRVEPEEEATPVEETGEPTEEAAEEETGEETAAETPEEGEETESGEETAAETPAESGEAGEEEVSEEAPATLPDTHTVATGENLYRIGLRYGIPWTTLARANNIANPNRIKVGQVLKIAEATAPESTPSPLTETTYTVKTGDNLYRIGLAYGISWVQIAEANGLVNPNYIKTGQTLKIPVSTPGPAPQFTHQVKAGETLFRIALQYGVSSAAIAEANNLSPPYVIYVGQSLIIPGG